MAEPIQPVPEPQPVPVALEGPASRATATEVLPVAESAAPPPPAPPRKRRRWLGWLVAVVVLIVLSVIGFFVAENYARSYAENLVRERIVEALALDPATEVAVDLGPGSLILQALGGKIDTVSVDVAALSFGAISGSAVITATGVPLDDTKPVETLGIVATVSEASVRELSGFLSGIELESIELGDGLITIGTEFSILGFIVVPVEVALEPSAVDGAISFNPVTISLNGADVSVEELRRNPQVAAIAGDLLASRDFCVASSLPQALTVVDVDVVGSNLVISIEGDGASLGGSGLTEFGVCKEK